MEFIEISGHKFNTREEADEAVLFLNNHHGLPNDECVSQFSESSYKEHVNGFYYLNYSPKWTSILGTPEKITIESKP